MISAYDVWLGDETFRRNLGMDGMDVYPARKCPDLDNTQDSITIFCASVARPLQISPAAELIPSVLSAAAGQETPIYKLRNGSWQCLKSYLGLDAVFAMALPSHLKERSSMSSSDDGAKGKRAEKSSSSVHSSSQAPVFDEMHNAIDPEKTLTRVQMSMRPPAILPRVTNTAGGVAGMRILEERLSPKAALG